MHARVFASPVVGGAPALSLSLSQFSLTCVAAMPTVNAAAEAAACRAKGKAGSASSWA